jgi:hypothetical protein
MQKYVVRIRGGANVMRAEARGMQIVAWGNDVMRWQSDISATAPLLFATEDEAREAATTVCGAKQEWSVIPARKRMILQGVEFPSR